MDSELDSQFDQDPDSIPETQVPATPQATNQPEATTHQLEVILATQSTSKREFHTMAWEPNGALVRLDVNLSLEEFLETLQDIRSEDEMGELHGFHYSLNESRACIVTMPDEFHNFRSQLNLLSKGAKISIQPLNLLVS